MVDSPVIRLTDEAEAPWLCAAGEQCGRRGSAGCIQAGGEGVSNEDNDDANADEKRERSHCIPCHSSCTIRPSVGHAALAGRVGGREGSRGEEVEQVTSTNNVLSMR
jgi:hypothetical protein